VAVSIIFLGFGRSVASAKNLDKSQRRTAFSKSENFKLLSNRRYSDSVVMTGIYQHKFAGVNNCCVTGAYPHHHFENPAIGISMNKASLCCEMTHYRYDQWQTRAATL